MSKLILASTSTYRQSLLRRLGVPFQSLPPRFDESSVSIEGKNPRWLAEFLARAKAASLADAEPGAVIIGCDQLVSFEGRIFGKPGSADRAVDQLSAMAGSFHDLITALVVLQGDQVRSHTDVTRLHMRRLTRVEIRRYVDRDRPYDCAGSYKLEEAGIVLFDRIETEDQTAITGLPLIALTTILRELGFPIP